MRIYIYIVDDDGNLSPEQGLEIETTWSHVQTSETAGGLWAEGEWAWNRRMIDTPPLSPEAAACSWIE